jgi:hypothetical protein
VETFVRNSTNDDPVITKEFIFAVLVKKTVEFETVKELRSILRRFNLFFEKVLTL